MSRNQCLLELFDRKANCVNNRVMVTVSVIIWGICAYMTGLINPLFSHDSLRELYTEGIIGYAGTSTTLWKIALGRFFWPVYQSVFRLNGTTILPFWNGLIGLVWLSVTAIIIIDLFNISNKLYIILFTGILTCNLAVIATIGAYIGDFDANMFGIMLTTLAVKEWYRKDKWSWLAIPFLVLALGTYQSNISIFISLVIFLSIIQLLRNDNHRIILQNGIRGIIILFISGVLYFLFAYLVSTLCHIGLTSSENGVAKIWDNSQINIKGCFINLVATYKQWFHDFLLLDHGTLSVANIILFIFLGVMGALFFKSQIKTINKCIVCILVVILPFGMNVAGFLNGSTHLLMTYSFWLLYILALLLPDHILVKNSTKLINGIKKCISILILFLLLNNIKLANGVYLKKYIDRQSTLSYMTRVVSFIEGIDGFDPQINDVLFIGTPNIKTSKAYSYVDFITGAASSVISQVDVYQPYFDYILQYPITIVDKSDREKILGKIEGNKLESFPSSNSYLWVDNTLIIQLQ